MTKPPPNRYFRQIHKYSSYGIKSWSRYVRVITKSHCKLKVLFHGSCTSSNLHPVLKPQCACLECNLRSKVCVCKKKKCATTWSLFTELSRKGYVMSEAMQANEAQTSDCSTPFPIPWRITQVRSCCQVKKISNQLFIASSFSDTLQIFPALKQILRCSDTLRFAHI